MIRHDARPVRRLEVAGDVVRGLSALAALGGLLVGVPLALLRWGQWPITGLPTWEQVGDLPTALMSDSTVVGIFTVALWVAWAVFAASVLAEAVVQARGRRRGLPVPSPLQRLAGHLVGSVMVAFGSFASLTASVTPAHALGSTSATPARSQAFDYHLASVVDDHPVDVVSPRPFRGVPAPDVLAQASGGAPTGLPATPPATAVAAPEAVEAGPVITVRRGDSPWGLAEAHLGDGMRWREMWEHNRTRPQPDGGVWANPDDVIRPGWQLGLPPASGPVVAAAVANPVPANPVPAEPVTVEPGDHFWGMAEDQLTEAWGRAPSDAEVAPYWRDTLDANQDRFAPPRDADDIYPGEQFVLPATPHDPLAPPPAPPPPPLPPPVEDGPTEAPEATPPPDAAAPGDEAGNPADQAPTAGTDADVAAPGDREAAEPVPAPAPAPRDSGEVAGPPATAPAPPATAAPPATTPVPTTEAAPEPAPTPTTTVAPEEAEAEPPPPPVTSTEMAPDAPSVPREQPSEEAASTPTTAFPEAPRQPFPQAAPEVEPRADTPATTVAPEGVEAAPTTVAPREGATPTTAAPGTGDAGDQAPPADADAPTAGAPGAGRAGDQAPAAPGAGDGPTGEAPPATTAPPTTAAPEAPAEAPAATPAPGPATTEAPAEGPAGEAPAAEPGSEPAAAPDEADDGAERPLPIGLIGGGLALAGLVLLLDRRRRAQLRHRRSGHRVAMPGLELEGVERELRAGADTVGARLVDAALRAAAAGAGVGGPPEIRWVEATDTYVTVVVSPPAPAPPGFVSETSSRWRTAASLRELDALGASASSPAPALVPVGTTPDGVEVLLDLEASGVVTVTGSSARIMPFLRSVAVAAATAPWTEQPRVLLVGMTGELTALPWVETAESLGVALVDAENRAAEAVDTLRSLQCQTTTQARAAGATPDAWEPLVVVSTRAPEDERYRVAALAARPGHAVAVVSPPGEASHGRTLSIDDDGWLTIDGLDLAVRARQLDEDDTRAVAELLDLAGEREAVPVAEAAEPEVRTPAPVERALATDTDRPDPDGGPGSGPRRPDDLYGDDDLAAESEPWQARPAEPTQAPAEPAAAEPAAVAAGDGTPEPAVAAAVPIDGAPPASRLVELLADIEVMVRVLGDVEAVRRTPEGEKRLVPGRQKALEAITYLALREVPVDREDLEIVLFPTGANATKTFHNTVAAARSTLGDDLFPPPSSGRYELSEAVVTDYGLFHELVASAEEIDDAEEAADVLSEALTLVAGEPFTGAGRGYAWVAPHRGMIVAQVVDVAEEVAEIRLATGDWRGAEWAARQGLRGFPCDERMYRLLMRAAHAAGNVPGVQRVFRELCDTVADPDDGTEPEDTIHPETVALLGALTGGGGRGQVSA